MSSPIGDYIRGLRAHIGHDPIVLATVSVLPRDEAGRLLLRRHDGFHGWGVLGGALNLDEDPRDGARRKAADFAVEIGEPELMGVFGGPQFRMTYPNGDQTANVCTLFSAPVLAGDDGPDVAWFTVDEVSALSLPPLTDSLLRAVGILPA